MAREREEGKPTSDINLTFKPVTIFLHFFQNFSSSKNYAPIKNFLAEYLYAFLLPISTVSPLPLLKPKP
jgi:hypothetical protein